MTKTASRMRISFLLTRSATQASSSLTLPSGNAATIYSTGPSVMVPPPFRFLLERHPGKGLPSSSRARTTAKSRFTSAGDGEVIAHLLHAEAHPGGAERRVVLGPGAHVAGGASRCPRRWPLPHRCRRAPARCGPARPAPARSRRPGRRRPRTWMSLFTLRTPGQPGHGRGGGGALAGRSPPCRSAGRCRYGPSPRPRRAQSHPSRARCSPRWSARHRPARHPGGSRTSRWLCTCRTPATRRAAAAASRYCG